MATTTSASKVIRGTWGQLWVGGVLVAECTACQLKITKTKETVSLCGTMFEQHNTVKIKGTGSITLNKVDSGTMEDEGTIVGGTDTYYTLVSNLADPVSVGAERVSVTDVNFDDITLADWADAKNGVLTRPFTFGGYTLIDKFGVEIKKEKIA